LERISERKILLLSGKPWLNDFLKTKKEQYTKNDKLQMQPSVCPHETKMEQSRCIRIHLAGSFKLIVAALRKEGR